MTAGRLLISLLIVASVLVDGVVLSLVGLQRGAPAELWPHPALGVLFALCFSQVSLTAVWAVLSARTVPWRLAAAALVVGSFSSALAALGKGTVKAAAMEWIVLLLGQSLIVVAPLLVARARGVRLVEPSQLDSTRQGAADRSPWQFSIGYLFGWITATAVVLGMTKYTVDFDHLVLAPYLRTDAGILAVGNSLIALTGLWAVLGVSQPMRRCAVFWLTVAGVLALYTCLSQHRSYAFVLAVVCVLQAMLLAGSLGVCRVAGFRLVRTSV